MAKQTAVEWLVNFFACGVHSFEEWTKAKELAKEMEKNQIIEAYLCGDIDCATNESRTSGQYYNDTYGDNAEQINQQP